MQQTERSARPPRRRPRRFEVRPPTPSPAVLKARRDVDFAIDAVERFCKARRILKESRDRERARVFIRAVLRLTDEELSIIEGSLS